MADPVLTTDLERAIQDAVAQACADADFPATPTKRTQEPEADSPHKKKRRKKNVAAPDATSALFPTPTNIDLSLFDDPHVDLLRAIQGLIAPAASTSVTATTTTAAPPTLKKRKPTAPRKVPVNLSDIVYNHDPSSHADLLATKWLNAGKLAELVQTQNLVYKKGKFSAIEEAQLTQAIDAYKTVPIYRPLFEMYS